MRAIVTTNAMPSPSSSSTSNADSSTPRTHGRLRRQKTTENEQLRWDKFNITLLIKYLETRLQLLEDGEGYSEAELLAETTALHIALKARELHRHMLKQLQAVDEPEDHHEQKKTARPGMQGETKGAVGSPEHYKEMCARIQVKLDGMTQLKQLAMLKTCGVKPRRW
ncbi:hypothetical protein PC116_g1000 [Phytophthora cactorum]|uniref:Uncharacterized protein n=2 Tax=Phytophthora cactorum TaxID=29920 RepID=A0A8T1LUL9_9STRA|nr:hypothetical protein Pcac1_g3007 [Phytophthora cactorum]KAG2839572.1 hypothetical protein PC111_g3803 [Phytophthora cactorum]KAG2937771.1 hypothetical protein PC115_g4050 [Phytophthora cactorum]KAG2993350.1 hypothetical protein PC118_g4057 [Phytophthora cactorum]KAG3035082.1 hypothetical protein PC120_g1018 [Phytophthora cactorum]